VCVCALLLFLICFTAADDFTGITSANVNFPSQSLPTVVEVAIQDDTVIEGTQQFFGRLRNNGTSPTLTIPVDRATVQIPDDDGKQV